MLQTTVSLVLAYRENGLGEEVGWQLRTEKFDFGWEGWLGLTI